MRKNLQTLSILFLIPFSFLKAQQDSACIEPKKLGILDIIQPLEDDKSKIKIISGSRFPISAGELPFSTYIITKEEIRQNGYETLVDALKMVPGIFTSQPGSAMEGETFLMRGLLGNSYTKILINDIPIKPGFLASMPIGAQLPIREAERIEIIYGAGAALYGADASAGVINIITRQSDRPVYMQADLAVGAGAYSSANVMFGGKWGKDKNILHYFAHGSNVIYENRNMVRNYDTNFNTDFYPWLSLGNEQFKNLPNYQEEQWGAPQFNDIPHQSRKFGLQFKFRRLTLSMETLSRRDHSAIGLNPVAVSYANPLTYTGEAIQRFNLNWFKEKENKNNKTDLTLIRYRLDDNSSTSFIQPRLAVELNNLANVTAYNTDSTNVSVLQPIIMQSYYEKYLSRNRFMYGVSDDFRIEHVRNYRLLKSSSLTFGGNLQVTSGVPHTNFLNRPPEDDCTTFIAIASPCSDFLGDTTFFSVRPDTRISFVSNLFGQWFYEGKRFNFVGGFNYSRFNDINSGPGDGEFLPRLALLIKLGEDFNARTSWGKSYRTPNRFYTNNTYRISSNLSNEISFASNNQIALNPEITTSFECGIRWISSDKIDADFTYFINETSNLINYGRTVFSSTKDNYESILGYSNASGSVIKYRGGQLSFTIGLGDRLDADYKYSWTKSSLDDAGFGNNYFLPEYSGRITQVRFTYNPFKSTTLILDLRRIKTGAIEVANFETTETKFTTFDLVGRYSFSDKFDTYFKFINLTDKEISGIPASRTSDDLLMNPQNGFFAKVGMNYYIE